MARTVQYNPSLKLEGELFERAVQYLTNELNMLREQRHLCREANERYFAMKESLREFKSTRQLGDAIFCARIRG